LQAKPSYNLSMTFTQEQSENLVQLLLIATLTDNATTSLEDDALAAHLESLPWTSGIGLSGFINSTYAQLRGLKAPARLEQAVQLCAVFNETQTRAAALQEIQAILEVDGVKAAEDELFVAIRAALA
jgi:hypothetical protein